jgi:hypothetical protein
MSHFLACKYSINLGWLERGMMDDDGWMMDGEGRKASSEAGQYARSHMLFQHWKSKFLSWISGI